MVECRATFCCWGSKLNNDYSSGGKSPESPAEKTNSATTGQKFGGLGWISQYGGVGVRVVSWSNKESVRKESESSEEQEFFFSIPASRSNKSNLYWHNLNKYWIAVGPLRSDIVEPHTNTRIMYYLNSVSEIHQEKNKYHKFC